MRPAVVSFAVIFTCAVLLVSACCGAGGVKQVKTNSITINLSDEKQVMHSFTASDAWTCQFVGSNWPIEKRNQIADLLFSKDVDAKGNPKGIGLSMWRFNIGAGSTEQGDASKIASPWQRAECFQSPDGTYDWDKQKGQQWFLQAAKERGVEYFLGFTNSPPVQFTLNSIAHSDPGRTTLNIREDAMPKFAKFLADVAEHFQKKGITFDYISPINEPQWDWCNAKQEGSPASNAEVFEITKLTGEELRKKNLRSKVLIGEAGSIGYLVPRKTGSSRADQVKAFWYPSSPYYLGDMTDVVAHAISAHSYFTTWPLLKQVDMRTELRQRISQIDPKLAYWQTEFCILEKNDEIQGGPGRDLGIDTALYVARVIHTDLTIANASHWGWWLAVSAGNFKDGLVYIDFNEDYESGKRPHDRLALEHDGRVMDSKLLWAMGNFSRFVRPGMVRVGLTFDDQRSDHDAAGSLMASAYIDKRTRRLVVVCINCTSEKQSVKIDNLGTGIKLQDNAFTTYTTSQTADLEKGSTAANAISIPSRSIVTLVGKLL